MSPFCGQCLGIARAGELRCPLDQEFFLKRDCSDCGQEVYPRELFCVHCAHSLAMAPEAVMLPADASRGLLLGGFALDLLGIVLLVGSQFWSFPLWQILPFGVAMTVLYRTLARTGGRQSFGQAVFHLVTVGRNAGPASPRTSAQRSVCELFCLPWSIFAGERALRSLDTRSETFEVRTI